jgi:hypothetical protein
MSDFNEKYPSIEALTRLRNSAIFYLTGGIILFASRFVAGKLVLSVGIGIIICAVAIGWLMANNPVNKRTGAGMLGIGILVILSGVRISLLPVITGILLSIISVSFFAMGLKNLFLYIYTQNKRY